MDVKSWLEKNGKWAGWAGLAALGVVMVLIRMHFVAEPLERNYTGWAYIAHQLLAGERLYTDLWDIKPPGIHILYVLGHMLWGYKASALVYLGMLPALASLLLIYFILNRISNRALALLGSSFWALAANALQLQGNMPASEVFINAFNLLAIWGLVEYFYKKNLLYLWLAGAGMAFSSYIKMHALFPFLLFCLYILGNNLKDKERPWLSTTLREYIAFSVPSLVLWLGTFAYFYLQHRFADFYGTVFVEISGHAGNIFGNFFRYLTHKSLLLPGFMVEVKILVLFTLGWALLSLGDAKPTVVGRRFWFVVLLGECLSLSSAQQFFASYYLLLLPGMVICSVLFVREVFELLKTQSAPARWRITGVLAAVVLAYLGAYQIRALSLTMEQVTRLKYNSLEFEHARTLGEIVKGLTRPGDLVSGYFSNPSLYFYSGRKCATRAIFFAPSTQVLVTPEDRTRQYYQDLVARPPAVFVWATSYGDINGSMVGPFIHDNYQLVQQYMYYDIYQRKRAD
ncbi:MAG: hypothetical protein AB1439_10860 [candidate division FCPU426 bacterium]